MLEKELCKAFGVDPFQQYIVNKMEAIEDRLKVTKTMLEYYSTINTMLKEDYEFLSKVRDLYAEFLNTKKDKKE